MILEFIQVFDPERVVEEELIAYTSLKGEEEVIRLDEQKLLTRDPDILHITHFERFDRELIYRLWREGPGGRAHVPRSLRW